MRETTQHRTKERKTHEPKKKSLTKQNTGERPVNSNFIKFLPWVISWVCESVFFIVRCCCCVSFLMPGFYVYIVSNMSCVYIEWSIAYRRKRKWKYRSNERNLLKINSDRCWWWRRRKKRVATTTTTTLKYQLTKLQAVHRKCHYIILFETHTRIVQSMTAVQIEQEKQKINSNHTIIDAMCMQEHNKPYQNRAHEILTEVTAPSTQHQLPNRNNNNSGTKTAHTTEIITEYMSVWYV